MLNIHGLFEELYNSTSLKCEYWGPTSKRTSGYDMYLYLQEHKIEIIDSNSSMKKSPLFQ